MSRNGSGPVRVLVTEGEGKPALAAVRSLGRAGCEVDVIGSGPWAAAFVSRYCHERFVEPSIRNAEAWHSFVLERVKARRYDALLLMGQSSAERIHERRELFEPHVRVLLPSPESFTIACDKSLTHGFAHQLGIPVPCAQFPADVKAVRCLAQRLTFPVVVKGPSGSGSSRVRFAYDAAQLEAQFTELLRLGEADGDSPPMFQEMIRGEGVVYAGLFQAGRPLAEYMWRRLAEYPPTGGPTAAGESIQDEQLRAFGRKIIAALEWTGAAAVEFKRDDAGTPRLIEINPRFWGALEMAIRHGVDLTRLYVETCVGRSFEPVLTHRTGRRLSFLSDCILLAHTTGQGHLALLREVVLNPGQVDVDWGDLGPTLRSLRATWWTLRKLRRRALRARLAPR